MENDGRIESITEAQWERIRREALDDPWKFSQLVIRGDRGVERFHRPMLYLMTRQADRFLGMMRKPEYESALMVAVRDWCFDHGINLDTDKGEDRLHWLIKESGVNLRISRSMAKTTYASVAVDWMGTVNPNIDIGIASKSTPAATKVIEACSNMFKSEEYMAFFPERIPTHGALKDLINGSRAILGGRTRYEQSTIEGRGLLAAWTGPHYDVVWGDDIVGTQSGEASIIDALKWIAALRGISKSRALGGTWRLFTGTIYDDGDDHSAAHANDETLLSVIVPIWIKPKYDIENILGDGVPTLPEWYDVDEIREMRKQTLAGPNGAMSWLNNFEMTTVTAGDRRISRELIRQQTLVIEIDKHGQEIFLRPDSKGKPVRIPAISLDRAAGLDQAVSVSKRADEWVFAFAGQDNDGHRYLIDGVSGKGYESMLAQIMPNWIRWGCPADVGIDTTGSQIITTDLMKREAAFQRIVASLRNVSASNVSKAVRIMSYIVAGLRMGQLWIHPRLADFMQQAALWNPDSPRANQPGTDDWLDAFSIALEVLKSIPTSEADLAKAQMWAYAAEKNHPDSLAEDVFGGHDLYDVLFDGEDYF